MAPMAARPKFMDTANGGTSTNTCSELLPESPQLLSVQARWGDDLAQRLLRHRFERNDYPALHRLNSPSMTRRCRASSASLAS